MANQAALENNPVAIESAAFCFSVNCSLNNCHTLHKDYSFRSMKFEAFFTRLMFDRGIFV